MRRGDQLSFPIDLGPVAERCRQEAHEDLPESLRQLLEVGFPGEAVGALIECFGGEVLYVPKRPGDGHRLVQALGEEATAVLCRHLASCPFPVPRGYRAALAARNAALRLAYDRGTPIRELVHRYRLTERQVRTILGQA